jgi:hypothetical protein
MRLKTPSSNYWWVNKKKQAYTIKAVDTTLLHVALHS